MKTPDDTRNVTAIHRRPTLEGGTYVLGANDRAIYVTQHSEYHCSNSVCVGVRSTVSGDWLQNHPACGTKLVGVMVFEPETGWRAEHMEPQIGDKLILSNDMVTSTIKGVRHTPGDISSQSDDQAVG